MSAYRLVILNDCDAPETRMIALVREGEDGPEWTYLSSDKRIDGRWLGWSPVQFPADLTDLEAFGVRPVVELRDGKHLIRVERAGPCFALYPDGMPRKWQGYIGAYSAVRTELLPAIKSFQRDHARASTREMMRGAG